MSEREKDIDKIRSCQAGYNGYLGQRNMIPLIQVTIGNNKSQKKLKDT
jgi:hypothetical protein